jgi:hypothetical protein
MIEGNFNIEVQIQVTSPTCVSQLQIDARHLPEYIIYRVPTF